MREALRDVLVVGLRVDVTILVANDKAGDSAGDKPRATTTRVESAPVDITKYIQTSSDIAGESPH